MRLRAAFVLALSITSTSLLATAAAQDQAWKATLSVGGEAIVLGAPVYVRVVLNNLVDRPIVMPYQFELWGVYCGIQAEPLDPALRGEFFNRMPRPAGSQVPVVMAKHAYAPHSETAIGWVRLVTPPQPGDYRLRYLCDIPVDAIRPEVNPLTKQLESNDEVWRGSFSSNEVMVQVTEPDGVDAQAYEAFDKAPFNSSRFGELLSKFPGSIYAAYVVWTQHAKGTSTWDTDVALRLAEEGNRYGNEIPCFHEEGCRPDHSMSVNATQLTAWENKWFSTVLASHPDAWFSDEVRLRLVLNLYSTGDHASCETRLEDLAEHGRPDVAAKAADVLAAMRAKGMLEGTEPPPAAAPVPVPDPAPAPDSAPAPAPGADR